MSTEVTRTQLAALLDAAPDEALARVGKTLRDVLSCPVWCFHDHGGDECGDNVPSVVHESKSIEMDASGSAAHPDDGAGHLMVRTVWESNRPTDVARVNMIADYEVDLKLTAEEAQELVGALQVQIEHLNRGPAGMCGQDSSTPSMTG